MKNILIGVLTCICLFFLVYSRIKADEAEKQTLLAELNLKLAKENEARVQIVEQQVEEMETKVRIAERKAEEFKKLLDNCR